MTVDIPDDEAPTSPKDEIVPAGGGGSPSPPVDAEALARQHQRETYEFLQRLRMVTGGPWVTYVLVAANVVVYLVNVASGIDFLAPSAEKLVGWGAEYGPRTLNGEWWRMLSSAFLHAGLVHVAVNMYALWVVGPLAERLLGHSGFAVLYTLTAITGAIASLWWNPSVIGVGASGAVCGVIGGLLGIAISRNATIPGRFLAALRRSVTNVLLINLVIGIAFPFIDNAAHLGGFAGGTLLGYLLSRPIEPGRRHNLTIRDVVVFVVLGGVSTLLFLGLPEPPSDFVAMHAEFIAKEERVVERANELEGELRDGVISREDFVRRWRSDVDDEWVTVVDRLAAAHGLTGEVAERHELFLEVARLRQEELQLSAELNGSTETLEERVEIERKLGRIRERMREATRREPE